MTSAVVSIIRLNRRIAAAAPSARSSQTPASDLGDVIGWFMAGGHAFDLFVELGQHLGAIYPFSGGVLDPLVVDRLGLLFGSLDEFGRSLGDLDADLFHALERGG